MKEIHTAGDSQSGVVLHDDDGAIYEM